MGFTALMYHSLSDGQHPDALYPKYTTRLETFRSHLSTLREAGYHLCSLGDLLTAHDGGQPAFHLTCALTFDDGHRSSLDLADAMEAAGVRGTFFLTAGYCREREEFLKPEEIRGLSARGFHFGTHGVTHRPLRYLPPDELRAELHDSRAWLEDIIGQKVDTMSLPAGQGSEQVRAEAFAQGYRLIGNSHEAANSRLTVPGEVNRFCVLASHGNHTVLKLASASPSYIWLRRLRAAAIWLPKKILRPYHRTRPE